MHFAHKTSVLFIKNKLSSLYCQKLRVKTLSVFGVFDHSKKEGHPVPESNLLEDLNNLFPQATQE